MIYTVDRVLRDVRVAMDENRASEQLLEELDMDTLSLNDVVRSNIEYGAKHIMATAPLHLIDGGEVFGDAVYWNANLSGWILLPNDFLRLVIFKMSDWERPVNHAIPTQGVEYSLQFSRCRGLRGTPQKPVVAIGSAMEGLKLEFFSCRSKNATVDQALYIPIPKIDKENGIDIPEKCYRAVVYMIAALTLITVGQAERGAKLSELAIQSIS